MQHGQPTSRWRCSRPTSERRALATTGASRGLGPSATGRFFPVAAQPKVTPGGNCADRASTCDWQPSIFIAACGSVTGMHAKPSRFTRASGPAKRRRGHVEWSLRSNEHGVLDRANVPGDNAGTSQSWDSSDRTAKACDFMMQAVAMTGAFGSVGFVRRKA